MEYPCTSCGVCCKRAGRVVEVAKRMMEMGEAEPGSHVEEVANFPYSYDETGRCVMLGADNRCMVYHDRPDICNIKKTWEKYNQDITIEQYFNKSIEACNEMMQDEGVDPKFYITRGRF